MIERFLGVLCGRLSPRKAYLNTSERVIVALAHRYVSFMTSECVVSSP